MSICNMMKDEKEKFAKKTVLSDCYKFIVVFYFSLWNKLLLHTFFTLYQPSFFVPFHKYYFYKKCSLHVSIYTDTWCVANE
jgi:hypothetical protein